MPADNGKQTPALGSAVQDISEKMSLLVREEIELAKAEMAEGVTRLAKGAAVLIAAGVFAIFGLTYLLHSVAWAIFGWGWLGADTPWAGFLIVATVLFVLGGVAGYLASKWLKSDPVPHMAIDEAKLIQETLKAPETASPPGTNA